MAGGSRGGRGRGAAGGGGEECGGRAEEDGGKGRGFGGRGRAERRSGVGGRGGGVRGPLGIEGEAGVLMGGEGGGDAGGERWDVPLVPDMPGVLSMGDVMGGAKHMASSTWGGAKEAMISAAHTPADTAAADTASLPCSAHE
ncbi:unnamed protein product [Closterium sp. Naga37s-1]|nr:unnamed protein product [Closterium sp. Naga37s-1]